jgi:hypothetical protein
MSDYPPYIYLIKCFENSPAAIFTYIFIWKRCPGKHLRVLKINIQREYLISFINFKEHIFLLNKCGLLKFTETLDPYVIEIEDMPIKAEGMMLC